MFFNLVCTQIITDDHWFFSMWICVRFILDGRGTVLFPPKVKQINKWLKKNRPPSAILGDPTIYYRHNVSDYCTDNLVLSQFPVNNHSNILLYRASQSIHVTGSFHIPQGVHVVFDAPKVSFDPGFSLIKGATIETRNEGCEL